MDRLTEYFVQHYTLIVDSAQDSYEVVTRIAHDFLRGEGVTFEEYSKLSSQERRDRFASGLGDLIIDQVREWFEAAIPNSQASIGAQLASEVMIFGDSDLKGRLGDHYLPVPSDVQGVLDSESDEEL